MLSKNRDAIVDSLFFPNGFYQPMPRIADAEGLTYRISRTGEMIVIEDVAQDVRVHPDLREDIRSLVGIPLRSEDGVVGVLFLNTSVVRKFSDTECSFLRNLADLAAIAIEKAELLRETKQKMQTLEGLGSVSRSVNETLSLKQSMRIIADSARHLTQVDLAVIHVIDESKKSIVYSCGSPKAEEGVPSRFAEEAGLTWGIFKSEQRQITNSSKRHYQSIVGDPIRLVSGEIVGVFFLKNISARDFEGRDLFLLERLVEQAAVAIERSRLFSAKKALVENSPLAIIAINSKGIVTDLNEVGQKLTGFKGEEVEGLDVRNIYWNGEEEARRIHNLLRESESKGTIRGVETQIRTKIGQRVPISLSAAILYSEDSYLKDEQLGSIGVMEDLRVGSLQGPTRRHLLDAVESAADFHDPREALRKILEHSVSLFGADAGVLFYQSHQGVQSMQAGDLLNSYIREDPIELDQYAVEHWHVIADLSANDEPLPVDAPGGSAVLLPLAFDNEITGLILLYNQKLEDFISDRDLSGLLAGQAAAVINRLKLYEEKAQAQATLVASANTFAMGRIGSVVVHEVRNSLNTLELTLMNLKKVLGRQAQLEDRDLVLKKLGTLNQEVSGLEDFLGPLNQFAQPMVSPEKTVGFLNPIVRRTLVLLEDTARRQQVTIESDLDPRLDPPDGTERSSLPILADQRQVQQVLVNLLLNAIDASKLESSVLVSTRVTEEAFILEVSDQGEGVREDHVGKIFNPFFTTRKDGSGLGLFICDLLVKQNHKGSISVASKVGEGAKFSAAFPMT